MDAAADFHAPLGDGPPRPALDLTEDPAILTAIANDIGTEAIFARQVIAHGRPGDVLLALSTSGTSANVIAALAEARRRGVETIAMVGYDGGRVAAEALADHVVVSRSEHIPRIQEAQATRVPRAPPARGGAVSLRARARVEGTVRASASGPTSTGWPAPSGSAAGCATTSAAWCSRSRAPPDAVERFLARLPREAPPLAAVEHVRSCTLGCLGEREFLIVESAGRGSAAVPVTADAATCDACLAELRDPADRRHRYPFINCTDCGPRFTIVASVPYDRARTTMAGFAMCPACRAEYEDPHDRRFHAEPNACPACGPRARLLDAAGADTGAADPVAEAARGAAGRGDRGGEGARRLPPRLPRGRRAGRRRRCAPASAGRTGRSR